MKKLCLIIFLMFMLLGITGCEGGNTSKLETVGEYVYSDTLECKAFDKDIKYFNYDSSSSKGWIVTANNDVYILNANQKYNSSDGNCRKLSGKFDDIVHAAIDNSTNANTDITYYYNSKHQLVDVDIDNRKIIRQKEPGEEFNKILDMSYPILVRNKYTKSFIDHWEYGDESKDLPILSFIVSKGDNKIYKATINYVKITKISGYDNNNELINIYLIPKKLYDGKFDADFNIKKYQSDNSIIVPVSDDFDVYKNWKFIEFNKFDGHIYKLVDGNLNQTYKFDSEPKHDSIIIPSNNLTEEIMTTLPDGEKIIDMSIADKSIDKLPERAYILTNKSYYRKLLTNPDCVNYSEVRCKYEFQKDEDLSKIRNDILFRNENIMILKNGRVYYGNGGDFSV